MNSLLPIVTATLALVALVFLSPVQAQEAPARPDGVEVLARGPIHEAYAQPANTQPEPGPVVTQQPPDPIDEVPPDQKPEGDNVRWIPGYWAWEEQGDYLWVSGSWRVPPPGRRWLPGHWQQIDKGWQWVAGFWAPANLKEVHYLPPPPSSTERGPSAPAPDGNSTYVPGCWVYHQTRYLWRPGHWVAYQPNWVWSPAHYVWTPTGCLFVEGYWDHPLHERGLLFAPVRIDRRLLGEARRPYIPRYVVHHDFLIGALFVRSANCHYYFGDYFEERYERRGFVPWVDFRIGRHGYDPNYSYYRHHFAEERGWERGLQELYLARRLGDVPRPPHTLVQQTQVINHITVNNSTNVTVHKNINITNVQNVTVLSPITQVNNTRVTNLAALGQPPGTPARNVAAPTRVVKLEQVPREQRVQEQKAAAQVREAGQQRRQAEAKLLAQGAAPAKHTDPPRAVKLELPKPPEGVKKPQGTRAPPPPPVQPKPEAKPLPKPEPPPKPEKVKPRPKPEVKPPAKPPEVKPPPKREDKPKPKVEDRPKPKPEVIPKPEKVMPPPVPSKPVEVKPPPKPEDKPKPKAEDKPKPKPEVKPKDKPKPKPEKVKPPPKLPGGKPSSPAETRIVI